ncbi:carbohydrate ABC transporter permease [Antribacter gilvus]|uniref:carbohydrate ABC transporter permease n=1 Tax=Antribacter gilvus TaxID=2304675 RepID=UPI000F7AF645|nr:carbohydrate ABC transporter permease [Antribacter gilvus]
MTTATSVPPVPGAPAGAGPAAPPRGGSPAHRRGSARAAAGRRPAWASRIVVNLVLAGFALYTLLPLTWLVIASTKDTADLVGTHGFALADLNFVENLTRMFAEDGGIFGRWMLNTVAYAGVGAALSVLVSLLAAFAFEMYDFRGKEKAFGFVLIGVLVPAAVTTMPLYLLASSTGMVNTFWGVFLPQVASPFGVYLARIFIASYVPRELIEAARIDGAGDFRAFFSVALPVLKPAAVTLFLMAFSAIWNNFFLPLVMLTDRSLFPVALGIYTWNQQEIADPAYAPLVIVGSLLAMLPVVALFLALQRYWKAGIGAGALK